MKALVGGCECMCRWKFRARVLAPRRSEKTRGIERGRLGGMRERTNEGKRQEVGESWVSK